MKKLLSLLLAIFMLFPFFSSSVEANAEINTSKIEVTGNDIVSQADASETVTMYRMYNPNSGEHFYTSALKERNYLISSGWRYEGCGWIAPVSGNPVYRLYNPNAGDHHYTASEKEKNWLVRSGWRYEGVGWYSGGNIQVYRQYNPYAISGTHNYTTSKSENDALVKAGWKGEGVAWNCVGYGYSADQSMDYYAVYHDTLDSLLDEKKKETYASSGTIAGALTYTLFDITGDGIKDLIVSWHYTAIGAHIYVFSYDGTKVTELENETGRHESDIRPAGNAVVYHNVNRGYQSIGRLRWNGNKLVLEWIAGKPTQEVTDSWLQGIFKSLNCGSPLEMDRGDDYTLLQKTS